MRACLVAQAIPVPEDFEGDDGVKFLCVPAATSGSSAYNYAVDAVWYTWGALNATEAWGTCSRAGVMKTLSNLCTHFPLVRAEGPAALRMA